MKKIINKNILIQKLHHNAYRCHDSEITMDHHGTMEPPELQENFMKIFWVCH